MNISADSTCGCPPQISAIFFIFSLSLVTTNDICSPFTDVGACCADFIISSKSESLTDSPVNTLTDYLFCN